MDDERLLARVRRVDDLSTAPRRAFVDALHADLATRLGLQEGAVVTSDGVRSIRRPRPGARAGLLVAAALTLLGAAAMIGAGSFIEQLRGQPTLLESIQATHTLRVAVRADHPQSQPALSALDGFDLAVAGAVAERLGARLDLVIAPAGEVPMPGPAGAVLAMPSRAIPAADAAQLIVSQPYYRWPVYLIRAVDAGAVPALDDLAGSRICVVAGSAGEAWLEGRSAGAGVESVEAPPTGVTVVARDDDGGCADALARREADAAVTARLLPGDLTVAGDEVVGGAPVAREPAVIVLAPGKGVGELQETIDGLLQEMRQDGTLRALSLEWFGGEDLTSP